MIKTMDDYMLEAQELARRNLENRKEITRKFVDVMKKNKYARIVLVGSGSSYNIANNVRYFMQKYLKLEVRVVWPSTFLHYEIEAISDDTLVVFLTQGGHSTNTVAAAEALQSAGVEAIAFTNWVDAPIKNHMKTIIGYNSTSGDQFVTKGFVMSSLFLMLASIEAALATEKVTQEVYDGVIVQLTKAIDALSDVRETAIAYYEQNREFLQDLDRVMTVGCGPTFGTALEAALKLTETYGCSANAYEVEEIIHGPAYEIYQNHTVCFMDTKKSKVHARMLSIYKEMSRLTDRVFLLTDDESVTGKYVLQLHNDDIEEEIAVLYMTLPFQYFSYIVCQETRVTSIDRRRARFQKTVASKLPGNRF